MLAEAIHSASDRTDVIAALKQASAATGSDFHYLLGTAMRESSLKPQAQSSTSSASGLFQFVGQTWLGLVKQNGAKYGLTSFANAISQTSDGHFQVANAADRSAILALRNDPKIASLMAGEFANQTRSSLENSLGRGVCNGELYAAHFLGPAAACKLIQMKEAKPDAIAANSFPQAAGANRNVFYHADGSAKTVREVYDWALKQPTGDGSAVSHQPEKSAPSTFSQFVAVPQSDTTSLLSSVMNWRPHFSQSSADDDNGPLMTQPFLLTPGVMEMLSSMGVASHG
ncbi:MAG: lytic transglycosylase [Gammaproteobacteria bacterium]|nr:lytic transglycosylase [Gammaproteobacteria bacterium]